MPPAIARSALPAIIAEKGVHLIGDFQGDTALCAIARDMAEMFRSLQVPLELLDLPFSPGRRLLKNGAVFLGDIAPSQPRSSVSLINWNGDINPVLADSLPPYLFQGRHMVGTWYWETELLPPMLTKGYDLVDEVWVTSRFIADALSKTAPVPIRHFPHLLNAPRPPSVLKLPTAIEPHHFVFLFCFDFRSVCKRKNPHGVCDAFIQAFPSPSQHGPICVIKSLAGIASHRLEYAELVQRYAHRPDILFIDGWVSTEERDSLMQRADCYVSLHRAEGLGLTMMECMALGKPCIATAYSGNMDFTNDENSWLIPYQRTRIGDGAWPYPPHHEWVEPDIQAAASAMREAFQNPPLLAQKGKRSRETMERHHGIEAVGSRMLELVENLLAQPPREKPALRTHLEATSPRNRAPQLLKESRLLQKKVRRDCKQLKGLFLPDEVKSVLQSMLEIISLQQEAQKETLRELSALNSRLQVYHDAGFANLMKHQELATRLLTQHLDSPVVEFTPSDAVASSVTAADPPPPSPSPSPQN